MGTENEEMPKEQTEDEKLQNDCFKYIADYAKTIYEDEIQRDRKFAQQASQMQTAFAFTIAALFVLLQIILKTTIPVAIIIWAFSTVSFTLLASLIPAVLVQLPVKRASFPDVEYIINQVINNFALFEKPSQRYKYLADTYSAIHKEFAQSNDRKAILVRISTFIYYGALALCLLWFVVMICVAFC